jgi:hypothetical protein
LWEVVHRTPSVFGRSVILVLLAALGAAVLGTLYWRAAAAGRADLARLLLVALAAWVVAQAVNLQAWQRYLEPGVLIGVAWLSSLAPDREVAGERSWMRTLGPAALAMLFVVRDMAMLYRPVFE